MIALENAVVRIEVPGTSTCLWQLTVKATGKSLALAPPCFEIDGQVPTGILVEPAMVAGPIQISQGRCEYRVQGAIEGDPAITLELVFRLAERSPVVRFRYVLRTSTPRRLTADHEAGALTYFGVQFDDMPSVTEIRLSEFLEWGHTYHLAEYAVADRQFAHDQALMGPLLVGSDGEHSVLVAYEHGSQAPDAFLSYNLAPDRTVKLSAVKGNYPPGRLLAPEQPYETIWFHAALVQGDETALAAQYRDFVLRFLSTHGASRRPLIFYNSWALQERHKWWHGGRYLDPMCQDRMLREIDVAHRMGIEVFVLDTGWYEKTGDWTVSRARFDDDLKVVKARLDGYGMRLGLWFGPTSAAISSRMLREHADCVMTWEGKPYQPRPVWETEDSARMCLVSRYADAFADELIRLARQTGVTYFKWDAVEQYGCDDPGHAHGTAANSSRERADSYAFELAGAMTRIVERLCAACPEAIVDFDITEGGRAVGLGFLSAGKYFVVNNGPYYQNLDIPVDPETQYTNLLVYPGQARTWFCRLPLDYDRWIPSVLFLTHYLPDEPASSQSVNLASLILGQNGIWGDLTSVTAAGATAISGALALYKEVRDDITAAPPVRQGIVGASPEIHEKINPATGRGAVVLFATAAGRYTYVTANPVCSTWYATPDCSVARDGDGRARIDVALAQPGAAIVLFGVNQSAR